uniref:Rhodanese domain-containing protein n=1 Tax=viral metagenome TaxID=1070528 RepID=A0A6C0KG22_9ZZZZ
MGNTQYCIKKINYENIINDKNYYLINTLMMDEQDCLIKNTISISKEESLMNELLKNKDQKRIYIYGKNTNDETIYKKYNQILSLGLTNLYVYPGGLFEWLLLQDIYGDDMFPTTSKEIDLLKYKPLSNIK